MSKKDKKRAKRKRVEKHQDWYPKHFIFDPKTDLIHLPPAELRRLRAAYASVGLDLRKPRLTFIEVFSAYLELIPEAHLETLVERCRLVGILADDDLVEPADEQEQAKRDATRMLIKAKILCRTNRAMTRWLDTPCAALGGRTPMETCRVEGGMQVVEALLDDMQRRRAKNPKQLWSQENFDSW